MAALLKLQQGDVFLAPARVKDHAQRIGLVRLTSIPLEPAEIEFHLPFVRGLELAKLQVKTRPSGAACGDRTAGPGSNPGRRFASAAGGPRNRNPPPVRE